MHKRRRDRPEAGPDGYCNEGENADTQCYVPTINFRYVFAFFTCRSNSLDWISRSNPLECQKKLRSAFTVCQYIDSRQMHQDWCKFHLPIRFQNIV